MRYRRAKIGGGTYFFTLVTYQRQEILCAPENITLLKAAFAHVRKNHPFSIDTFVVLPDHLHCLMTLPDRDDDYPARLRLIKSYFSRKCTEIQVQNTASRRLKKEKAVWQRRYWEHSIKNDTDLRQHVGYIHYNPVKHGLANAPIDWPYSSFHSYVARGMLHKAWGSGGMVFDRKIGME